MKIYLFYQEKDVNLYLKGSKISFSSFELKTSSISICIIDDCKEADVPVLDLNLNHLHLVQK